MFLVSSKKPLLQRAQFKRLRDYAGDSALLLNGPFSDNLEMIAGLTDKVKERMCVHGHPAGAALATLSPQNIKTAEKSWLPVPFIIDEMADNLSNDSAGFIACTSKTTFNGSSVIPVGLDELTLLSAAVLRRLNVPCLYSYAHTEKFCMPSILIPDKNPQIISFFPPFVREFSGTDEVRYLEVLDDSAILSIMRLKAAGRQALILLKEFYENADFFQNEVTLRAIGIAHVLYQGDFDWTLKEAHKSVETAREMFGQPSKELTSIRIVAESTISHWIKCPNCHILKAADLMLCENAKKTVETFIRKLPLADISDIRKMLNSLDSHDCVQKLQKYMHVPATIAEHRHSECRITGRYNA